MTKNEPVIHYKRYDKNNKLKSIIQYIEKDEKHDKCLVQKWLIGFILNYH